MTTQTAKTLTLTRVFDAPRARVFEAWIDPTQMAQWWGPNDFTNPVCELDARPGGAIRIDMRGPDGTVYPMKGTFREIIRPERLVFTSTAFEGASGTPQLEVLNTVTFAERNGKTTLALQARVVRAAPEVSGAIAGMDEGWSQSLERLAALTRASEEDTALTTDGAIVATRLFDAPRERVFRMWTDPQLLERWWGPNGFTLTTNEIDVRAGGGWRFVMHGPDGRDYINKIAYLEVAPPERLVYKHRGEEGTEPVNFQVTATFAEQAGKTKLTIRMQFPSVIARDHVIKTYGAFEGMKQTLGRLKEQLAATA